ncbi:OadG family protein [Thermophagus xiamenensis]|uniref:Oxaloacetate decarboxylase, gamma chain n=1 Tax=Thermophagus xiamenensis TaxID=385682 RepID=A0A1I1WGH9_9BACT|nr:OadG family protein [Thermophagus xiamenensis]SFD94315.1 Oxaloacetate decarboxylase, gamma chain [Thermophagus xiamenensis]
MNAHFEQAWLLLGVGMVTVFAVLFLVVLIGNSIIFLVNRFFPGQPQKENIPNYRGGIEPSKIAVITAAVNHITGGRGNVVDIKKKQ